MARKLLYPTEEAAAFAAACGVRLPEPKKKRKPNVDYARIREETREMIRSQSFAGAKPSHFVALYELMHEQVYGVEATDMTNEQRRRAGFRASQFLGTECNGDPELFARYVRWFWRREKERETWRKEEQRVYRATWGAAFSRSAAVEFRMALARGVA